MSLILCLHWSISIEVSCLLLLWNSLSLRLNRRLCCCCVFVRLFVVITFPFLSYAAISYCAVVVVVEPYCSPELGVFAQPAPPFLYWDTILCCCCCCVWCCVGCFFVRCCVAVEFGVVFDVLFVVLFGACPSFPPRDPMLCCCCVLCWQRAGWPWVNKECLQ